MTEAPLPRPQGAHHSPVDGAARGPDDPSRGDEVFKGLAIGLPLSLILWTPIVGFVVTACQAAAR